MKIALFATGIVGDEIAKFFGDNLDPLAGLVIDSKNPDGLNSRIVAHSGMVEPGRIFESDSLREAATLKTFADLQLDLIILAWWPYIIRTELIEIARLGCLNFHPSYLPYNRGKHYNFWAIVEEAPFGVTLHWVSGKVDCGDIAFQSRIDVSWEDTGATLYRKAQTEIVRLFKEKFAEIKQGHIPRVPQDLAKGSFHKGSELDEASKIELDKTYTVRELLNLLRARTFPPHPAAWFDDGGDRYEVRVEIGKVRGEDQD